MYLKNRLFEIQIMFVIKLAFIILLALSIVSCKLINISQLEFDCKNCTSNSQLFVKLLWFGHMEYFEFVCVPSFMYISKYAILTDVICFEENCSVEMLFR